MDTTLLTIIIGSTLAFLGLVIWKIWWLLKKIPQAETVDEKKRDQ